MKPSSFVRRSAGALALVCASTMPAAFADSSDAYTHELNATRAASASATSGQPSDADYVTTTVVGADGAYTYTSRSSSVSGAPGISQSTNVTSGSAWSSSAATAPSPIAYGTEPYPAASTSSSSWSSMQNPRLVTPAAPVLSSPGAVNVSPERSSLDYSTR